MNFVIRMGILSCVVFAACTAAQPKHPPVSSPASQDSPDDPFVPQKTEAPTPEARLAWSQAVYSYEAGDYETASKNAAAAISGGMDSRETRQLYAESLAYAGHLARAEAALKQLIEHYSAPPSAYFLLGKIYLIWGKNEKAEQALSKALTSGGGADDDMLYQLGNLQLKQGLIPRAIESFKEYVDHNPSDPEGLTRYAVALLDGGRAAEAEAVLRQLLLVDPQNKLGLFTLALLTEQKGLTDQAAGFYDRLLELDPDNSEVLAQRANLAETQKAFDTAIAIRKRIMGVMPTSLQNRYRLGQLLVDAEREVEAREIFLTLAKDFPELGQPYVQLAYIEIHKHRNPEAIRMLAEAAKRMPTNPEIHSLLGFTYLAMKEDTAAVKAFKDARKLDPKNVNILFALGEVQLRLAYFDDAVRTFQTILTLQPSHSDALNFLGYMYAERGIRLQEAERLLKKALESEPSNAYYLDSLGWVYFKKGKSKMALEYIDRASKILTDPVIFEHLGDVLVSLGSIDEARQSYERSFEKIQSESVRNKLLRLPSPSGR